MVRSWLYLNVGLRKSQVRRKLNYDIQSLEAVEALHSLIISPGSGSAIKAERDTQPDTVFLAITIVRKTYLEPVIIK